MKPPNPNPSTTGVDLAEVAGKLVERALVERRVPSCFTIGWDIELSILRQLAIQATKHDNGREAMQEYSVNSLAILGLPVHRMAATGIALHTRPCP